MTTLPIFGDSHFVCHLKNHSSQSQGAFISCLYSSCNLVPRFFIILVILGGLFSKISVSYLKGGSQSTDSKVRPGLKSDLYQMLALWTEASNQISSCSSVKWGWIVLYLSVELFWELKKVRIESVWCISEAERLKRDLMGEKVFWKCLT